MTKSDKRIGQPLTGEAGRVLYRQCIKPIGLTRDDVGLWSLDSGELPPEADGKIIVAVGQPAAKSLGGKAVVTVPHPMALTWRKDTGETARKVAKVLDLLRVSEDAQGEWVGEWDNFVPPTGGQYAYQEHDVGGKIHYDLRMTSSLDGRLWGWTMYDGGLGGGGGYTTPKKLHISEWLTTDGELPNGDTMSLRASGDYKVLLCHDNKCILSLSGLTNSDQQFRVTIEATGKNESGVPQWVSLIPAESASKEMPPLAEITGGMRQNERLIYSGSLMSAGSVESEVSAKVSKAESSKQIVYGIVLDPYIFDAHGDWTPPAETEDAAHKYMMSSRQINFMHLMPDDNSFVVESWLEPYPSRDDYLSAMGNRPHRITSRRFGDDELKSGMWVMGVKLSDELWAKYLSGELNGFSPFGLLKRTNSNQSEMPAVEVVNA
jgi:hypothetical protein